MTQTEVRNSQFSFGGKYKIAVLNADRSIKSETPWFDNLITDIGLDRLAQGYIGSHCRVGTGNTAPANGNTALVAQIASTSSTVTSSLVNAGSPNYQSTVSTTYEFALGAVVGSVAEVGVGWSSSGSTLFSRALILDVGLSPTTITVLVTEILQVTYALTVYQDLTDTVVVTSIGGVSTTCTSRAAGVAGNFLYNLYNGSGIFNSICIEAGSSYVTNGSLGAVTSAGPTGTSAALSPSGAWQTYTPGSYTRDASVSLPLAIGNLAGGISAALFTFHEAVYTGTFRWQIGFSPAIAKTSSYTLTLVCRCTWGRH